MERSWAGLLGLFGVLMGTIFLAYITGFINYSVMLQVLITTLVLVVAAFSLLSNIYIQTGKDKLAHFKEQLDKIYVPLKRVEDYILAPSEHQIAGTELYNAMANVYPYYLLLAENDLKNYLNEYYTLTRDKKNGFIVNGVRLTTLLPQIRDQVNRDYDSIRAKYDRYFED